MARETVPSQQLNDHTNTINKNTTASSSLEKFASDCLNQNGDLSQVAWVQTSDSCGVPSSVLSSSHSTKPLPCLQREWHS